MLVGGAAGGEAVLQRGGRLGVAELDPLRQSVTPSHDKLKIFQMILKKFECHFLSLLS